MSITHHKFGRLIETTIWECEITERECRKIDKNGNPDCDNCDSKKLVPK